MPAPATIDEFIEIIGKSGVAETAKIKAYVQKLNANGISFQKPEKLGEAMVRDGVLTFFQTEQLLQGKWKRFFIGKYKVLERIGTGGMGQVFLCEHKLMKRRVALKVLPAQKAQDPASLERFYREARAVAALDHPNIVRAYDIDQDENIHFLVMEFVDGPNLQDLVKKIGPMNPTRAAHYVYGAAVGMQHAHEMGIVHRDIKPGNVLVDRTGTVKLLDMGLARFFNDEDDLLTKKYDENVLGTADYLAPEQAVDSHGVDIRADIYSLGGTFYFMLTGLSPFPEGTIAQKLLWHQTRDPKPIRSIRPEVPQDLVNVIEKMLKKKPDQRYQTPGDLMAAMLPFVQTPIAPPEEFELPAISVAASAANFQAPRGPSSQNSGNIRSSVMGSLPTIPGFGGPLSGSAYQTAGAAVAVAKQSGGNQGWASLSSDTQPKGLNDTARNPRPDFNPDQFINNAPTPKSRLFVGVGLGILLAGGIAGGAYWFMNRPVGNVAPVENANTIYVTKGDASPGKKFDSLKSALAACKPGTKIVLLDETIEEPAIGLISNKANENLIDCKIESGHASKQTKWIVQSSTGASTSAIELQSMTGFSISGLTIDCNQHCKFGISILGHCPGLTVENSTIRNGEMAGIRIDFATGDTGRPIKIDRVNLFANPNKPMLSGILVIASPTQSNKAIAITNCRIEGQGTDGIRIAGLLSDFELTGNTFINWKSGVTISSGLPGEGQFKMSLTSNTIAQCEIGIRCDTPLSKKLMMDFTVKQNLFAKCTTVTQGPSGAIPSLTASDNAKDKDSKDGSGWTIPTTIVEGMLPSDATNTTTFMRTAKNSPFGAVGEKKVQVGAPILE